MKLINATQMMFEETEAYISAQAQITDKVDRDINYVVHWKLQQLLADAPEVDAVEVVRCKDCKYCIPNTEIPDPEDPENPDPELCWCGYTSVRGALMKDFYCSYGERKGDE